MTTKRATAKSTRPTLEGRTFEQLRQMASAHELAGRRNAAKDLQYCADWLERRERVGFTGELIGMWREQGRS